MTRADEEFGRSGSASSSKTLLEDPKSCTAVDKKSAAHIDVIEIDQGINMIREKCDTLSPTSKSLTPRFNSVTCSKIYLMELSGYICKWKLALFGFSSSTQSY